MPLEHVGAGPCEELPVSRDLARLRAFGAKVRLTTDRGEVASIDIREGDLLHTRSGGTARVAWTDRLDLDAGFLRTIPALRPVLFCAGDFGAAPRRNIVLSPEQFVWYPDFETGGEFRRAAEVSPHPDVYRRRDVSVTYVSILCDVPAIVEADGLWIPLIP